MAYVYFDSSYAPVGFLIVPEGGDPYAEDTILVQTDWDFPSVAQAMGWRLSDGTENTCPHEGTDGTVPCKECGATPGAFISAAYDFIREHAEEEFPGLDEYVWVDEQSKWGSMDLIDNLAKTARILCEDEQPNSDSGLQALVGDPADTRISTFVQFKPNPGTMQMPNPLSPIEGDEVFFSYLIPGAVFQAHDGSEWWIESYTSPNQIEITNRWYPRTSPIVSINDIRRSIHQWVEPITQTVPPPPPGVDYSALPVKIVEGVGSADANTGLGGGSVNGGW